MPGGRAFHEPHQRGWTQRCVGGWSDFRDFCYGVRVAWVSAASAAVGLVLYLNFTLAQDLFLEAKGHPLSDALFWAGFYLAVVLAWALPVFVSARWILVRFEEGPRAHAHVVPVKTWVRRRVPLLLGAICLLAIGVGQLMALRNIPYVHDVLAQEVGQRAERALYKGTEHCRREATPLSETFCIVRAVPGVLTTAIGRFIAEGAGHQYVPQVAYIMAAYVMLWFLFARPSPSSTQSVAARYARRFILALACFTSLTLVTWPLFFLLIVGTGLDVESHAWSSLTVPALWLLVAGTLAWRGMERSLWWLGTISAIPIAVLVLFGLYAYVSFEFQSTFGLAYLVLLPATTVVIGVLLWWLLTPFSDGRASRAGQLLDRLRGGKGQISEDEATLRFIDPLFVLLLVLTVAVIAVLVVVHPLHITEGLRLHRALLLPFILGMPVALFTYITHWSARTRVPLIIAAVVAIGAFGAIGGDNHAIRFVRKAPPRMDLQKAVNQWAKANGCENDRSLCPPPIIIAAAGGASRSAFLVAGVIGTLLDGRFPVLRGHHGFVMMASFDREGTRILTASRDGTAMIWDAASGRRIHVLDSSSSTPDGKQVGPASDNKMAALRAPASRSLSSARFSPDGKLVVTASEDKTATIWDAETGTVKRKLEPHGDIVTSAEFSHDGNWVVTSSKDKLVRIWDATTGDLLHELPHQSGVVCAAFHPLDRRKVASGAFDNTIRVWDVETGKEIPLRQPMRHDRAVRSIAFSPDGEKLVTASDDETARVWEFKTGEQRVLKGHYDLVYSASFSADNTRIITASWDDTVRVWDAKTYERVKVLWAHSRDINFAAFSGDGGRIVTASDDGTAIVWNARTYERYKLPGVAHPFGRQLFAISAVSGGSLAAVLTYAALADARPESPTEKNPSVTGIGLPPCTEEGLREDQDWFRAQPDNQVQSWRDCLQLLTAGDFLSPVLLSLASNDSLPFIWTWWRGNRAAVLEHAWEARYARLTGKDSGLGVVSKEDGITKLAQSLSKVRWDAAKDNVWLPVLLLNGTSVETGRRIVTSDVDTRFRDADGKLIRVFVDSYDLHERFFRPDTGASASSTKAACQECDIRLSTAATMSARFPIISPPGGIVGQDAETIVDRVVDGGYYENFGATTAMELALALDRHFKLPPPVIVLITNNPHTAKMECVESLDPPRSSSTPWFPTFSSPLDALLGTSNARATHAAVNLCKALEERFGLVRVKTDPKDPPDLQFPLSWWLSKRVQKALDAQIDEQHNLHALTKISPRGKVE